METDKQIKQKTLRSQFLKFSLKSMDQLTAKEEDFLLEQAREEKQ